MNLRKELVIAAAMFVFGVGILPALIFVVGITIVGPYEGESGLGSLYAAIIGGLADLQLPAWILLLGPYAVVQCLRLVFFRARPPVPVTTVTK